VRTARALFHLPYYDAAMSLAVRGEERSYRSSRTHADAPPAKLDATWRPAGPPIDASPGSLERWLTERYCLYAADPRGQLLRCDVDHPPWALRPGEVEVRANTMASAAGIPLPGAPPLCHLAERLDVLAGRPLHLP
jgi:uncharacterized protein YqjF (DUF2071 family)